MSTSNSPSSEDLEALLQRLNALVLRSENDRRELESLRSELSALLQASSTGSAMSTDTQTATKPDPDLSQAAGIPDERLAGATASLRVESLAEAPDQQSAGATSSTAPTSDISSNFAAMISASVEQQSEASARKIQESGSESNMSSGGSSSKTANPTQQDPKQAPSQSSKQTPKQSPKNVNLEKFIGENLINKIGIVITVLGVGIGAKYAIEHELISPLTRIVLGYLLGLGLFGIGSRLRANYEAFSAVLVSGSMAILYFISYAAHTYYYLLPQSVTFALMALITLYTVVAALKYNREVIGLIGLVGAYAVPILLSDGSGRVEILFGYVALINTGILIVSMKRSWLLLNIAAFVLTWFMYMQWYESGDDVQTHIAAAWIFVAFSFVSFYIAELRSALRAEAQNKVWFILMLSVNALLTYYFSVTLFEREMLGAYEGLFTLAHAAIHFVVFTTVYRQRGASRTELLSLGALVLFFITITIPIQLHGSAVPVAWAAEALLLSYLLRKQNIRRVEGIVFLLMLFAFGMVAWGWDRQSLYFTSDESDLYRMHLVPFLNGNFVSFLLVSLCTSLWLALRIKAAQLKEIAKDIATTKPSFSYITFFAAIFCAIEWYGSIRVEISGYFQVWSSTIYSATHIWDSAVWELEGLTQVHFAMLFLLGIYAICRTISQRRSPDQAKSKVLINLQVLSSSAAVLALLMLGLSYLMNVSYHYEHCNPVDSSMWVDCTPHGPLYLWRYVSFALLALSLWMARSAYAQLSGRGPQIYSLLLNVSILAALSNEVLHWLPFVGIVNAERMILSVLWGLYSLALISYGIVRRDKTSRLIAIAFFGLTLLKLFIYDLAFLGSGARTVAFIALGLLLLVISFLYNKYKTVIFDDQDKANTDDQSTTTSND